MQPPLQGLSLVSGSGVEDASDGREQTDLLTPGSRGQYPCPVPSCQTSLCVDFLISSGLLDVLIERGLRCLVHSACCVSALVVVPSAAVYLPLAIAQKLPELTCLGIRRHTSLLIPAEAPFPTPPPRRCCLLEGVLFFPFLNPWCLSGQKPSGCSRKGHIWL